MLNLVKTSWLLNVDVEFTKKLRSFLSPICNELDATGNTDCTYVRKSEMEKVFYLHKLIFGDVPWRHINLGLDRDARPMFIANVYIDTKIFAFQSWR